MVPGKYAKLIKQGKYAKVPAKFLTPDQQKIRTARIRAYQNRTLYNPLAQLSGNQLRSAVNQIVNAQINPQLSALDRQRTQAETQGSALSQRIGGYYNQSQQLAQQGVAAAANSRDQIAAMLASIGQQTQGAIGQAEQTAQGYTAQDQALRGIGLDAGTSQRLAADFARQKISAAQQISAQQSLGAAQGQGALNAAQMAAQVLPSRAADAQLILASQVAKTTSDILGKKQEIEATRPGLFADTLTKLRQSEFEKAATMETLNIQGQQAATSAYNAETARKKLSQKSGADKWNEYKVWFTKKYGYLPPTGPPKSKSEADKLNRAKREFLAKYGYLPPTGPPKGKETNINPWTGEPWLSQAKQVEAQGRVSSASADAKKFKKGFTYVDDKGNKIKVPPMSRSQAAADLTTSKKYKNVPEIIITAALDRAYLGYLSNTTLRKLRKAGYQASKFGIPFKPSGRETVRRNTRAYGNAPRQPQGHY